MRREASEVLYEVKNELPQFNREELLDYIKWGIPKLHNEFKNENSTKMKCSEEFLGTIMNNKSIYRITKDIDHITVQFIELSDCFKDNDEFFIKVYCSVYFYDNTENNENIEEQKEKYWNDIWIVTVKESNESGKHASCSNCGAVMEYNAESKMFECKYCENKMPAENTKWEIVNIEVEKDC